MTAFFLVNYDIATWVIFAIIAVIFCFGLKRIYHNFANGKCDGCGTGGGCSCSSGCHCCNIDEKKKEA